jgi:hypothetical protein
MKLNTKGASRRMISTFLSIPAVAAAADSSALVKIFLFHASSICTIPFILFYLKLKGIFTSEISGMFLVYLRFVKDWFWQM